MLASYISTASIGVLGTTGLSPAQGLLLSATKESQHLDQNVVFKWMLGLILQMKLSEHCPTIIYPILWAQNFDFDTTT